MLKSPFLFFKPKKLFSFTNKILQFFTLLKKPTNYDFDLSRDARVPWKWMRMIAHLVDADIDKVVGPPDDYTGSFLDAS